MKRKVNERIDDFEDMQNIRKYLKEQKYIENEEGEQQETKKFLKTVKFAARDKKKANIRNPKLLRKMI